MKCKKCGHVTKDINAMRKHYLKNHPGSMRARKTRVSSKSKLRAGGNAMMAFEQAARELEKQGFRVNYTVT